MSQFLYLDSMFFWRKAFVFLGSRCICWQHCYSNLSANCWRYCLSPWYITLMGYPLFSYRILLYLLASRSKTQDVSEMYSWTQNHSILLLTIFNRTEIPTFVQNWANKTEIPTFNHWISVTCMKYIEYDAMNCHRIQYLPFSKTSSCLEWDVFMDTESINFVTNHVIN